MKEELNNIKNTAVSMILEADSLEELESIKLQYLGRSGTLTIALKNLTNISASERPEIGKQANEVKEIIEDSIRTASQKYSTKKIEELTKKIDVTEEGIKPLLGHTHLITQAINEITSIFEKIGYERVRYPEIEWDWYAFGALNFPPNHPARDDWETFFIDQEADPKKGPIVLTPHTSSGQPRQIEKVIATQIEPYHIRMLNIAKCYRRQSDVSHTAMFHQFEGMVVGKNISVTHLKGTLDYFVKSWFGENRVSRIRPYQFQFTEPSFEVDVSCGVCLGKGCRLCKEGWLEMGGSGMVHPNVLRSSGIDPEKYTGFAFGWGVERVLMMKEGIEIDDLRLLYSNNMEFLEQF